MLAAAADKDSAIRATVEKAIDILDDQAASYVDPDFHLIGDIAHYRIALVAYLKSLDDRPVTPWKSPGS
jgi:hypothetical protein